MGSELKQERLKAFWVEPDVKRQVAIVCAARGEDEKDFVERACRKELTNFQVQVSYIPQTTPAEVGN